MPLPVPGEASEAGKTAGAMLTKSWGPSSARCLLGQQPSEGLCLGSRVHGLAKQVLRSARRRRHRHNPRLNFGRNASRVGTGKIMRDTLRYFIRRNDPNGENDFMVEMDSRGDASSFLAGTPISLGCL